MIEQELTSLLSKRVRRFLSTEYWAAVRLRPEKEAYTSIKSDEEWTSRVLPSEPGRYCKIHLIDITVIELQFYHFPDSDGLRVGSVTD